MWQHKLVEMRAYDSPVHKIFSIPITYKLQTGLFLTNVLLLFYFRSWFKSLNHSFFCLNLLSNHVILTSDFNSHTTFRF